MKVLAGFLKSAGKSNLTRSASKQISGSVFTVTKQATSNVSKAVKVSDEEIAKLMSQGVIPMKYTFKDIIYTKEDMKLFGNKIPEKVNVIGASDHLILELKK